MTATVKRTTVRYTDHDIRPTPSVLSFSSKPSKISQPILKISDLTRHASITFINILIRSRLFYNILHLTILVTYLSFKW